MLNGYAVYTINLHTMNEEGWVKPSRCPYVCAGE